MCGIVGGISPTEIRNYVVDGLKTLEYRGYDSAGIALFEKGETVVYRVKGRVGELDKVLPHNLKAHIGVGHTRWATHGEPSVVNAHPQSSASGLFTIVHNGVIDNFRSLKKALMSKGYEFKSETDTEVIAILLEDCYIENHDALKAISKAMKQLKGSYALAILFSGDKGKIFFAKNRSPLVIGHAEDGNYLASDYLPMLKVADQFVTITDFQYGYISLDRISLFDLETDRPLEIVYHKTDIQAEDMDLAGYPHYMLKEIEEADDCIRRLIDNYFDGTAFLFDPKMIQEIKGADNIVFLACGTSYHACLIGSRYMRQAGKKSDVYIASEWAFYPYTSGGKTIFIVMSQSGETADLIHCMSIITTRGASVITITNTQGSSLSRSADYTLLLYAGLEIAVASTKAYIAQVTILALLLGALEGNTNVISDLEGVTKVQKHIIDNRDAIKPIADFVATKKDVYFLGRGYDYDLALECSLKLKEITYIHSEAFPGGELKHGPIALIEKDTPVIGFVSDPITAGAIRSNFQEVKARGARVISISSMSLAKSEDAIVVPEVRLYLMPLVKALIGQYLAYYVALKLDFNIDKPRNLAKAVTVE